MSGGAPCCSASSFMLAPLGVQPRWAGVIGAVAGGRGFPDYLVEGKQSSSAPGFSPSSSFNTVPPTLLRPPEQAASAGKIFGNQEKVAAQALCVVP